MNLPISIDLPNGFLDAEVRCGYEVSSEMKKVWAVELDLLKIFSDVCKSHNIKFQVFAGTLLGAVRHKGFIPWDDDLDVCMDRENYEKLLSLPNDTFPNPYFLQTAFTDKKFFISHARLRNSSTSAIITGKADSGYNNGIFIDIHVLDGYINNKFLFRLQFVTKYIVERLIEDFWNKGIKRDEIRFATIVSFLLKPLTSLIGYENLVKLHTSILTARGNGSKHMAILSYYEDMAHKYVMSRAEFSSSTMLPFEFLTVPCPSFYDCVLTRIYGDYMKFPPQSIRGKWHDGIIVFNPNVPYKDFLVNNYCNRNS